MKKFYARLRSGRAWQVGLLLVVLLTLTACIAPFLAAERPTSAPTATEAPTANPVATAMPGATAMPVATEEPAPAAEARPSFVAPELLALPQEAALIPSARGDLAGLDALPEYSIQLKVDLEMSAFSGKLQLDYYHNEDTALDRLYFRLLPNGGASYGAGSLQIDSLSLWGEPLEYDLSAGDTVMEVPLPQPAAPGDHLQLEMAFHGETPRDFGLPDEPSGYGIYNFSDNVLALSGWYPILAVYDDQGWNLDPISAIGDSVYSDAALYRVELDAPVEAVVASTGTVVERQEADGRARWQLVSGPARDFFIALSPDFAAVSREVAGTEISSYYLPGDEQAGEMALEIAAVSLETFNERFGAYPYRKLDVVEVPLRYALGVEYPGIILIASQLYEDTENPSFAVATAHEVAHQWWYNVVGNDVFDEPWLDEGLTTYSSSLYYETLGGARAAQGLIGFWRTRYASLLAESGDEPVTETLAYFESLPEAGVYGGIVYTKGALFFDALRQEIGDQAFFEALQNYYQSQKYQIAEAEDLLSAFEQAADRDLDALYAEWLY